MGAEEEGHGSGTAWLDFAASPACTNFCILIFLPPFQERKDMAKSLLEEVGKHGSDRSILKVSFLKQ